ncbi:MAG: IclR family transcriptional regulator [Lachnospiraceae bacterium]|nr:IclR family transcriptional regulator [Lachnospiraceae bacterium]
MTKKENYENGSCSKSLIKTLQIMELYARKEEYGIKEISENTNIPPSTVQRIVNTLVMREFLTQNTHNTKYRLGMAFFRISSRYSHGDNWIQQAKLHMEKLVDKHHETVNLAELKGTKVMYLAKVESPFIVRPNFDVGTAYPAVSTALGRCLLSQLPNQELKKMIELSRADKDMPLHIKTQDFINALEKIRERGYAVEDEEFQKGLFCIAAPVYDRQNKCVAAISTSIPKQRLDFGELPELVEDIKETANAISKELQQKFAFEKAE